MTELAGHPDVREALEVVCHPQYVVPDGASAEKVRGAAKDLIDRGFLRTQFPHVWLAEVVHCFYATPELPATVWDALWYCSRFRLRLSAAADSVLVKWKRLRNPKQKQLRDEWDRKRTTLAGLAADMDVDPVVRFANTLKDPAEWPRIRGMSEIMNLTPGPPHFIATLLNAKEREAPAAERASVIRGLLRDPKAVANRARDLKVPVPFTLALEGELRQILDTREIKRRDEDAADQPPPQGGAAAPVSPCDGAGDGDHLSPLRKAFNANLVGLAFSGGGIRSATFNLGVLQSLATLGVLRKCDYLSTVSGGGYIGSWFAAWLHRQVQVEKETNPAQPDAWSPNALKEIFRRLSPLSHPDPLDARVRAIRYLREFSNYLTPRTGFLSADSWTMAGIYLRNTLLNQVILGTFFAALLLLPRIIFRLMALVFPLWRGFGDNAVPTLIAALYGFGGYVLVRNLRRLDPNGAETRAAHPAGATPPTDADVPRFARPGSVHAFVIAPWMIATSIAAYFLPRGIGNPDVWERFGGYIQSGGSSWRWIGFAPGVLLYIAIILLDARTRRRWRAGGRQLTFAGITSGGAPILITAIVNGVVTALLTWGVVSLYQWARMSGADVRWIGVGAAVSFYLTLILFVGGTWRCWSTDGRTLSLSDGVRGSLAVHGTSVVSGAAAAGLSWVILWIFHQFPYDDGYGLPWHAAAFGAPAFMAAFSLVIVVQLGLLGNKFPDEHREWWSRLRSYIHMQAIAWLAWFVAAMWVPWGFHTLREASWAGWTGAGGLLTWLVSTYFGVSAGHSAQSGGPADAPASAQPSTSGVLSRLVSTVAPYVFIVGLVIGISLLIDAIYHANADPALTGLAVYWRYATETTRGNALPIAWGMCIGVCLLFARRVDINAFSMHHFYKNRLVRCYLGASRADERKADWFTGFDPDDDMRLAAFDHQSVGQRVKYPGPYPILNGALNLVGGKDLAWQERKAESFVFTPKYCGYDLDRAVFRKTAGQRTEAYFPTQHFYRDGDGPLLGMATAISGAAANPNMGRATSPASAFLMTVFNARLGWWLGNSRNPKTAVESGPPFGLRYTLIELTGNTNDESDYVNVSDGGHFDNLGVYELIRRGCRYIIACDAGQDGKLIGEDLGDLVRRCRTDFGVDIDISIDRIRKGPTDGRSRAHCVVGKIHYLNIPKRNWRGLLVNEDGRPLKERDQPAHEVGYLIYLKPSITGDEPNDVTEYGALVPAFPHESTADQWFSESQFEAYRKLGMHVAEQSFCRFPAVVDEIDQLFERLYKFWYPPTLAVGAHSTEHTKTYSEIMEVIRTSPRLVGIDHAVFEGLPPGGTPPLDPRDEFYICTALIQLIEDVYADLDLELNWDHPHVEGWMAVFRRWARQEAFRRTWALSRTTYAERFRLFYNDRLIHHRNGLRPLSLPRNFVAAHRGLWNHVEAAQNTLPAFHDAIEAGAHLVEMDVRRLQDGTLVVYHDADVARELLSGLTALAFQAAVNTMTAQKGWAPTQLLTLDECLRDLYGRRIALNIELKDPGIEADVLRIIHDTAWAPEDLLLTSFHPGMLENIRAIRDDIQTGLLIDGPIDVARARALAGVDVDCIAPEDTPLSTDVLDAFAADGIAVVPWNVTTQRLQFVLCHPATVGLTTDNVVEALRVRKQIR